MLSSEHKVGLTLMGRTRFKIPPCAVNPKTEQPYKRHKWVIVQDKLVRKQGSPLLHYHVVCDRPLCKLNSPNPIAF